jgi:hypothetical protein
MNYFAAMLLMHFPCVYRPNDSNFFYLFQGWLGFTTFAVFMSANHKSRTLKIISIYLLVSLYILVTNLRLIGLGLVHLPNIMNLVYQ